LEVIGPIGYDHHMQNSLPNGYVHGNGERERERERESFLVFISFINKAEGKIDGRDRDI